MIKILTVAKLSFAKNHKEISPTQYYSCVVKLNIYEQHMGK